MREKKNELTIHERVKTLERIVRVGTVSAVDPEKYTARVKFPSADGVVSTELLVLRHVPLITVERWADGEKWDFSAEYATYDRALGLGETYDKAFPDVVENEISLDYRCPEHGVDETKTHRERVSVRPWLPFIDQVVLCLFLPFGKYQGFVLGGLNG